MWFCEAPTGRGEPVPVYARGKLYVVCGKPGDAYCVKPGGSGKVTATHRLWTTPRKGGRDLPTPAVVDDILFISSMSGIGSAYDAETGAVIFNERLGEGIEIAAAPLVANGLVYFQVVHGGEVIVVKPGKTLEIVAKNSLGEGAKGRPSAPCRCPSATASSSAGIDAVLRREVRRPRPFEPWRGIPLGFAGRF